MNSIPLSYNGKPLIHSWPYRDAVGTKLGIVARYQNGTDKKDVVPYFKRNGSGWTVGIESGLRPLFGLDKLATQPKNKPFFITEGEKASAALQSMNVTTVTSMGGSNAAKQADWAPLSGFKMVYLLPDNDEPGEHYMRDVYLALMALETPPQVKVLRLSDLPEAGDIVDWIKSWGGFAWDGYAPIPEAMHKNLIEALREDVKKAEAVPDDWRLDSLGGLGGSYSSGFEWEKPNAIESKTPPVQVLHPELIPAPFRGWLADVSHRMQTPGDFAAISSIVIVGSIIGAGCGMRPKRLDDWEVIPNVWGACIGRPSVVLKSPSMKEPMQLLERLQAEYGEQFEQNKKGFEFDNEVSQSVKKSLKADLDKAIKKPVTDKIEIECLRASFMELDEAPEATRRLFKTNETSIQSMTVLQTQNERGILVFRDELTGLLVNWDREDKQDERAYFLEGWNGDGSYTDVKIERGLTDAKNICISMLGGIQPDKLKRYLYQATQGNNDGLIQRLQLAVWPDEPESWQLIDTVPNKAEKQRAYGIVKALAELDFAQYGAVKGEYDDRPYFRFDEDGQAVFNEWLTALQTVKIQREDNPLMVEHFGKFRSLMPSLALIFHCINIADGRARGSVSAQAARLAVQWCEYLETHARRVYAMAESPEHEAAVRLADKIKSGAVQSPFTAHDIYHKGWHGLKDKQEVDAACGILIDESWLMMQRKPKPSTGRPPAPEYHINPKLFENG